MKSVFLFYFLVVTIVMTKAQDLVLDVSQGELGDYTGPIYPGCLKSDKKDNNEACFNTLFSNDVVGMLNLSNAELPPCDYISVPVVFKVTKNGVIENIQVDYPENQAIQNELLSSINKINSKLESNNQKIASAVKGSGVPVGFIKRVPIIIKAKGITQFDEKESIDGEKYFANEKCGQVLVYKGTSQYNKILFNRYNDKLEFKNKFEEDFKKSETEIGEYIDIESMDEN